MKTLTCYLILVVAIIDVNMCMFMTVPDRYAILLLSVAVLSASSSRLLSVCVVSETVSLLQGGEVSARSQFDTGSALPFPRIENMKICSPLNAQSESTLYE